MLIISRTRQETEDLGIASLMAKKFNIPVLNIPLLYDLPGDNSIVERLRSLPKPVYFLVPLPVRATKSMLNNMQIPFADVFEVPDAVQIPDGGIQGGHIECVPDTPSPRWYPIIDDSKCSACLECVNYCLFGVYAIGNDSRPFVDQPDACRDGCPACARVCPSQAIMFPLYEDRGIAGYEEESAGDLNDLVDIVDQISGL